MSDALFFGSDNRLLLKKTQGTDVFAHLSPSRPAQKFIYNHLGYHVVGCVIEQLSSMSYSDFLAKRIFEPLNMERTFTTLPPASDQNIAQVYVPYHDRQLRQVPPPSICSDMATFTSGCVRSCLRDLMAIYSALLRNFIDLMPNSVFKDLNMISRAYPGDIRTNHAVPGPHVVARTVLRYGLGANPVAQPNEPIQRQLRPTKCLSNHWRFG